VGLTFRAGFNVKANFENVGRYAAFTQPGAATSATDHRYDDGYNLVDATGNNHFGELATQNWGYQNNSQYNASGNGSIAMHSSSSAGGNSGSQSQDLAPGFEISLGRDLVQRDHWTLGVEGAFNFSSVDIRDGRTVAGRTTRLTDTYDLGGITPALAPYDGSFGDPGALLGDAPTRSTEQLTLPVTGSRQVEASIFGFRFGPYLELPITKKFSALFNAGLAVAIVDGKYSFNESIATPDRGNFAAVGVHDETQVLLGGYAGLNLAYAFTENWSLIAGAQWQDVGKYSNTPNVNGAGSATLDLRDSIFVNVGVAWQF